MRIAVSADELTGIAASVPELLRARGHEPVLHGAYVDDESSDWAWAFERAASEPQLQEILDAWLSGAPSTDESDTRNIAHVGRLDARS